MKRKAALRRREMELLLRTNFDIPKPLGGVFDRKSSSDTCIK